MKYLILFTILIIAGCSKTNTATIDEAELMANENPDSALTILNSIDDPSKLKDPELSRYWLTIGKAHHATGYAMTEDSMLVHALEYYRNSHPVDSARLLQATLLTAKYYWWKGNKDKCYKMLTESLDNYVAAGDSAKVRSTLNMLSTLSNDDNDYQSAKQYLKMLIDYNSDEHAIFIFKNGLGIASYFLNETDSTKAIYEDILKSAHSPQDSAFLWERTIRDYADILSSMGDQHRAIELNKMRLAHFIDNDKENASISYAAIARCYLLLGELGKARQYLQLSDSMQTENLRHDLSESGHNKIMHIMLEYACSGNFDFREFALFVNNLQSEADRINKISAAQEQAKQHLVERNLNLTISRQRGQITILLVAIAGIITVVALCWYGWRKKRLLEEKTEELEALKKLLSESQHTEATDDRFFKKVLLQQLGVIRMAAANPTTANQEMLKRMNEIANKDIAVDSLLDWNALYKTIDYTYAGYYTNLKNRYGSVLNEKEMQLCCLLRANFSTKEISVVTQQGIRTVYQRKTVIRQKLGIEEKGDIADFSTL